MSTIGTVQCVCLGRGGGGGGLGACEQNEVIEHSSISQFC